MVVKSPADIQKSWIIYLTFIDASLDKTWISYIYVSTREKREKSFANRNSLSHLMSASIISFLDETSLTGNYRQNERSRRSVIFAANEKLFWAARQNRHQCTMCTLTRPRQFKPRCNENCQLHIAIYVLVNRDAENDRKRSERCDHFG